MTTDPIRLTLLHTNDMHAHLKAMSRLSTFAKALRRELEAEGRQVLMLDAGDEADRSVHFIGATKGYAFPPVMEAMGYDLQTMGNAISVTYGPQAAMALATRSQVPMLAANFQSPDGKIKENFRAVMEFDLGQGISLGVIGLTVHAPRIYALFGLATPDYRDVAREWADKLISKGVRPLIAVTHVGMREDRALAERVPELEVIIGGHSHTYLPEGELVHTTLIAQTGNYAENLGRIDLEIDPHTGKVLSKQACLIPIPEDTPLDPAVEAAIQAAGEEGKDSLLRPVGTLQEALRLDYFGENEIGHLGADAIRERMHAEVCLLTGGLFNKSLPAGMIRLGDLDSACFSTANPQLSQMKGAQLAAAIERSLDPEWMNSMLKVFRGAPVGRPVVSGMTITYAPTASNGQRVREILVNGQPLELERTYRVAHTDAEVIEEDAPIGYFKLERDQILKIEVPTIVREAIEDYLQAHAPTPKPLGRRWITVEE